MKYAYDHLKQLHYITTVEEAEKLRIDCPKGFFCPHCGQKMNLRIGQKKQPYFQHRQKRVQGNSESALHLEGKAKLAQGLAALKLDYKVEAISENKKRRADIAVQLAKQEIALEWQCASIDRQQIYQRTQSYRQQKMQAVWILGPRYYWKGHLREIQRSFLQYRDDLGFFLIFLEPKHAQFRIVHHIRQFELTNRVACHSILLSLVQGLRLLLGLTKCQNEKFSSIDQRTIAQKRKLIQQKLLQKDKKIQQLQARCYQQGHNLQLLPELCFENDYLPPLYPQVGCFVNTFFLLKLEMKPNWTYAQLCKTYQQCLLSEPTVFLHREDWDKIGLNLFLKRLIDQKILQYNGQVFQVDQYRLQDWQKI